MHFPYLEEIFKSEELNVCNIQNVSLALSLVTFLSQPNDSI